MIAPTEYEPVLAIVDYWDSPRTGIALFKGTKCYFDCIFDEQADEYSQFFKLTPLSPEALAVGMSQWETFVKWRALFDRGQATMEMHPKTSNTKLEYEEGQKQFQELIASTANEAFQAKGDFVPSSETPLVPGLSPWKVRWSARE